MLGANLNCDIKQGVLPWMKAVALQVDTKLFGLFLCVCWAIWWFRYQLIMEGKSVEPSQVSVFAARYLESYLSQINASLQRARSVSSGSWSAPPLNFVKTNFDGAVFAAERAMGIGAVARNPQGQCTTWLAQHVNHVGDGELAETWAAREAIQLAVRKDWRSVVIEGDCAPLIQKLCSGVRYFSSIGPIVYEILSFVECLLHCHFNWVQRSGNEVAHFLAQTTTSYVEGDSVVPPSVLGLLSADFYL
ncbi:hypothetical protein Sango_1872000 [Sesamum angolense]|uniref:RNase H type-1 domain-containing protein n=1 Tax=Sesamum angolense TaxID=2727404 RepID=A0AAE1WIK5_9LAMI|nr:hypothetical protein Sango_1872000 [Sesamum angolense]